jgi:hypothetical protein
MAVIGHVGEFFSYAGEILVPTNTKVPSNDLQALVNQGVRVLAHEHIPDSTYNAVTRQHLVFADQILARRGLKTFEAPQAAFTVVKDIEGQVLGVQSSRNTDGVESSWVSPLDLIMIPKLVGALGAKAFGKLIYVLFRRGVRDGTRVLATQLAVRLAARRVGRVTVDEMEQLLAEVLANRPELRRLMAARVMTGEGRMQAIKIAWQEWERTQGWRLSKKPPGRWRR